jgi:hypothetical protein
LVLLGCVGILSVATILVAALLVLFALAVWSLICGGPSAEGLQQAIEQDIPVGSPLEDIQEWLATEGRKERVEGSCAKDELGLVSDDSTLLDRGLPPDMPVCRAIVHGNPALTIRFILDRHLRFQQVVVEREYVLP